MRHRKLFSLIFIAAATLLFTQCTTEPIPGPPGQDGVDGVDGIDGIDGATGTTECASCHNIATTEQVHASYLFSGHANGSRLYDRESCSQCHSSEGYISYIETGMVPAEGFSASNINCITCHGKHTSFDFEEDGYDYALRNINAVNLITEGWQDYSIDFNGTANNCTTCHQSRRVMETEISEDGTMVAVGRRYGPHHGPQSNFLEGIQGQELMGSTEYPLPGSAAHRTGTSCTSCHMGETSGEIDGNHTWIPTPNECSKCHSNGIPEEVGGLAEDMDVLLTQLLDIGILAFDEDGELGPVTGDYPILQAQAAWNYLYVVEDQSMGIHNPSYARALVKVSAMTTHA